MPEATATAATAATPATGKPLLRVENLCTWFPIRRGILSRPVGHVKAVNNVSFEVREGETLGLVGESGCGKTTLGRTLLRLQPASSGAVHFGDQQVVPDVRNLRAIRRQMQMIFQDPFSSLNPRMTVLDIVTEAMQVHGLIGRGEREAAGARLLGEVGLGKSALYRYPHEFSGGQRQRISIARALSLRPQFVVCDEAVSALDVSVQAQVINLLMDLSEKYRLSYLFISHDLSVVRHISDRVAVMYMGEIVESGPTDDIIERPKHPYTQALISAVPVPGEDKRQRIVLEGDVPSVANPPPGCKFHTRCPHAMEICGQQWPEPRQVGSRQVFCHLYPEAGDTAGETDKP